MVGRKAARSGVRADVGQPDGTLGDDDLAEQPPASGKSADVRHRLRVDAMVNESLDPARRVVHAEGCVPGTRDGSGVSDHATEDLIEIVLAGQLERSLQQPAEATIDRLGHTFTPAELVHDILS
jgi:hypothetical protein